MASQNAEEYILKESLLNHEEDQLYAPLGKPGGRSGYRYLILMGTVVVSLLAGYSIGQTTVHEPVQYGLATPPGSFRTVWDLNTTFIQRPTLKSEAAWNSLVPVGRGFVHHPQLAPFVSNIAVFHQLHCLHGILVAYYKALESPPTSNFTDIPDFDHETGVKTAVPHIHHCFDYLRQTIMCAADTNMEVLDRETHATNGFGQTKKCRNYEHVFAWAERYANSSDTGILS
ncbi:hypothetical protein BDV95DRAFT_309506 [Massariosphaeria phaeospora]|uniref:Tat pathway signal sequence n=1 Tax=Massariosphaeria phaeospora TaxID=100035 RepID=A0A7C8MCI2_9PLEO|nr:hypothetical protein BDV95DRAFT_309506 [Massariosphaeria phaeospora]